jgi:hypothetical protein
LRSGSIVSYQLEARVSNDHFTLFVTLDLHLTGTSGVWNEGTNDRLVTFFQSDPIAQYMMELNSGP